MALAFTASGLDRIKRANPIAQVVAERGIPLRKKGQVLVGRCLFHRPDKTPSLTIYPNEGRFHCFGSACGADGDVIGFVMKADGASFPEAVKRLCGRAAIPVKEVLDADAKAAPKTTTRRAAVVARAASGSDEKNDSPAPVAPGSALALVVDHYHRRFLESAQAQAYAKKRGLLDAGLLRAARVGYADGSLLKAVPRRGALRDELVELGVITAAGKELLGGCLVVPLPAPLGGHWTNLYGRGIRSDRHCYLPGPPRGVFNFQAACLSEEVILTESILDALSFLQAGISSVIPIHGTNGLTADHVDLLKRERVQRVILALDNDDAGRKAVEVLGERLQDLGLAVRVASLPEGIKDPNELLLAKGSEAMDAFAAMLADATPRQSPVTLPVPEAMPAAVAAPEMPVAASQAIPAELVSELPPIAPSSPPPQGRKDDELTLTRRGLSFQARVYPALLGRLRATVRVSRGSSFHLDTIDLLLSKSRTDFARKAVKALGLDPSEAEKIEGDLLAVLVEAEKVTAEESAGPPTPEALSESERAEASALLRRPDLLDQVVRHAEVLGFVGESSNVKLLYLVALSRRSSQPLSAVILSQSGAGKSVITEIVEQLTPPEDVVLFTRLTPQSLYYTEPGYLDRKLVIIEERHGSQEADYSVRVLQSRGKLIAAAPVKDPATGNLKTRVFEVVAKAAFIEATTAGEVNHENATRCFELAMDESVEQTRRIHERQRFLKTEAGLRQRDEADQIRRRHWNAQRLLEPLAVIIPFAGEITFPATWMRTRRDHARFLNLIEVSAFVHQAQRERRAGAVVASVADYAVAYELARDILAETLADLKRPLREAFERIRELADKGDGTVSRREVRETLALPDTTVRRWLADLCSLEYLAVSEAGAKGAGKTTRYRVAGRAASPVQTVGLLSPEELRRRL